jgi:hypothetical protein
MINVKTATAERLTPRAPSAAVARTSRPATRLCSQPPGRSSTASLNGWTNHTVRSHLPGSVLRAILIRVLRPGLFPQDRPSDLRERCTAGDRYEPLGSDGSGPNVDQARRGGRLPVLSGHGRHCRSDPPRPGWIGRPGTARPIATVDSLCQSSLRTPGQGTRQSWQRTCRR